VRAPLKSDQLLPRSLLRIPVAAVSRFVDAVRGASDQQLHRAMGFAPARRAVLEAIFRQMPRYLDRKRAENVRLRSRWQITRPDGSAPDVYELAIDRGRARVRRGIGEAGDRPVDVTITVDGVKFLRLVTGTADPMRAYLEGDLAGSGDIMAAARLVSLFRMPGNETARKQNTNTETPARRAY
jgi:hypothetical protein